MAEKRAYKSHRTYRPMECPECGVTFTPTHHLQTFCVPEHKQDFHTRNRVRGTVVLPFLLAWRKGKRGKSEDSAYALQQLAQLADRWTAEDREAGRRSDLIVSRKRQDGWIAADLD